MTTIDQSDRATADGAS